MRIYVFGSSIVSAYWNGAATYYRGIFRALAALGHTIDFCEPDIYDRQANRDLAEDPEWVRVRVYRGEAELERLLAEAAGAELVVKCSGVGALDGELEERVATMAGPRLRAFWDVDAADTLARVEADPADPLRRCIPRYDIVFTYGGGEPVVERYTALGARACHPIYNGLDPDVHHPVASAPELACDLVFMGNRLPDRERRVEELFLAVAERLPEGRFMLGGNGWGDRALPANVRWLGHVPTALHNAINCSARLVLNVHREAMARNGYSPATRMFEAAGAGACQITDAWPGIEHFFEPDREILVAEGAADIVRFVRETPERRVREIGAAARARAVRDHSYAGRARQVDEALGRLAERGSGGRS
ncbi:MAG TPA: glycosyltransferase [Longimicrobiales bacterium]|nr:glycosyltransferase [Longimicrobiales bacterium]